MTVLIAKIAGSVPQRRKFVGDPVIPANGHITLALTERARDHFADMVGAQWINVTASLGTIRRSGCCMKHRQDGRNDCQDFHLITTFLCWPKHAMLTASASSLQVRLSSPTITQGASRNRLTYIAFTKLIFRRLPADRTVQS
jgi:hypothetical protein